MIEIQNNPNPGPLPFWPDDFPTSSEEIYLYQVRTVEAARKFALEVGHEAKEPIFKGYMTSSMRSGRSKGQKKISAGGYHIEIPSRPIPLEPSMNQDMSFTPFYARITEKRVERREKGKLPAFLGQISLKNEGDILSGSMNINFFEGEAGDSDLLSETPTKTYSIVLPEFYAITPDQGENIADMKEFAGELGFLADRVERSSVET
jgi:hypothetical protein